MDWIRLVQTIAATIVSVAGAFTIFWKLYKKFLMKAIKESIKSDLDPIYEKLRTANKSAVLNLRYQITDIYYEYKDQKAIPMYRKQLVDQLFDRYFIYHKENSFITNIHQEMNEWEVLP